MQIVASPREIVVAGAGIVGCAIADELSRRGASVTVVDDRAPGMGATQASAGVLAPFIEARLEGPLLELTARSLGLFDDFIARLRADSAVALTYQRTGTLDVALDSDALAVLVEAHARLASRGIDADLLDSAAVCQCEPHLSSGAVGGLLIPTHGFVAAAELTRALAAAAERRCATFVDGGRVTRVTRDGDRLRLHRASSTPGAFQADVVIVAAGSWAGTLQIEGVKNPVPVRPVRGQLLQLHWAAPAPLRRILWSERCYVVPWPDGTVLVGATEEDAGFDERTTLAAVLDLIDAVCELLPQAWTASLMAAKVGLRPGTPDQVPIIGWSTAVPNLMYATGHYRNGILLAPLTAELVANAVLDGRIDPMLELTRPQRFGEL
jgi:glycine oxidase